MQTFKKKLHMAFGWIWWQEIGKKLLCEECYSV